MLLSLPRHLAYLTFNGLALVLGIRIQQQKSGEWGSKWMNRTMMVWFDLKASSFSSLTKLLLSFINLNSTKKNKSLQSFNYKEGLIKTVDDITELLFCFGFCPASQPCPSIFTISSPSMYSEETIWLNGFYNIDKRKSNNYSKVWPISPTCQR